MLRMANILKLMFAIMDIQYISMIPNKEVAMDDKYHILLVEDDEEIRSGIEIYLKNQGYEVYQAGNGAEGLKVLETETIHLAILDIMMPVMDGITMLLKMREKEYDFPVIMLTAKSEVNVRSLPDVNSERVGALVEGDQLELVAVEDGWCTVKFEGTIAYVSADFIDYTIF